MGPCGGMRSIENMVGNVSILAGGAMEVVEALELGGAMGWHGIMSIVEAAGLGCMAMDEAMGLGEMVTIEAVGLGGTAINKAVKLVGTDMGGPVGLYWSMVIVLDVVW